MEDGMLKKS